MTTTASDALRQPRKHVQEKDLKWLPKRKSPASSSCRSRQAPPTRHRLSVLHLVSTVSTSWNSARRTTLEITVYEDRSFTFITKTPPAAELIKKAAGVAKGSATPHTVKVAKLTQAQVNEIATQKLVDLNANDVEAAAKIIAGTARSMGITVEG